MKKQMNINELAVRKKASTTNLMLFLLKKL